MKTQTSPAAYRWTMLFLATFIIVVHSFVFQSIPPVMGELAQGLGLSYTQLGGLTGVYSLSGALLSITAGILAERYGARRAGTIGLLCLLFGTVIVALSAGYGLLFLGRVVGGAGSAFLFVVAPVAVSGWFVGRELGLAMGIYNTAIPAGTILAFNLLGPTAAAYGWQAAVWITVVLAAVGLLVYQLLCREAPLGQRTEGTAGTMRFGKFLRQADLSFWLLSLTFALYSASILQVFTIGPSHFSETYGGSVSPDLLASLPTIVSLLLMPLAGKAVDMSGRKDWLVYAGCLGSALFIWLIPSTNIHPVVVMLALGVFMSFLLPALYAFPADILHPGEDNMAFGVISFCFGIGVFFGAFIVGALRDVSGDFAASFYSIALMCLGMMLPVIWIMRRLRRA